MNTRASRRLDDEVVPGLDLLRGRPRDDFLQRLVLVLELGAQLHHLDLRHGGRRNFSLLGVHDDVGDELLQDLRDVRVCRSLWDAHDEVCLPGNLPEALPVFDLGLQRLGDLVERPCRDFELELLAKLMLFGILRVKLILFVVFRTKRLLLLACTG